MKIAFDTGVSNAEVGRLIRLGHEIVCVAGRAEPDETWIERALDLGAEIIFSDDLDVPNYLDRCGYDGIVHKKMWYSKEINEEIQIKGKS